MSDYQVFYVKIPVVVCDRAGQQQPVTLTIEEDRGICVYADSADEARQKVLGALASLVRDEDRCEIQRVESPSSY